MEAREHAGMGNDAIGGAIGTLDEVVETYCQACRDRVAPFVEREFSLREAIARQRASLFADLLCYPLNALWAVPYLTTRKVIESLDKVGWSVLTPFFDRVPSGIKTRYQREVERKIYQEVLEWPHDMEAAQPGTHALVDALSAHPSLTPLARAIASGRSATGAHQEVCRLVDGYSSGRMMVSDLAGFAGTIAVGWMLFKDGTLGLFGIGERLARERAREAAVSRFTFGKGLGTTWYRLFPPEPSPADVAIATILIGAIITVLCLVAGVASDPLGKAVGFQKRKLRSLVDDLEHRLRVHLIKILKDTWPGHTPDPAIERRDR